MYDIWIYAMLLSMGYMRMIYLIIACSSHEHNISLHQLEIPTDLDEVCIWKQWIAYFYGVGKLIVLRIFKLIIMGAKKT